MSGSSIPAAIDALFAHAEAVAADVPGAAAYDGPRRKTTAQTYLVIGYAAGAQQAAEGDARIADLGRSQDHESYAVACHATTWAGNGEFKPLRDDAFALVAALAARVAADRRLGGAVMQATVAAPVDYRPSVEDGKPTVVVPFHVQIDAMRRNS